MCHQLAVCELQAPRLAVFRRQLARLQLGVRLGDCGSHTQLWAEQSPDMTEITNLSTFGSWVIFATLGTHHALRNSESRVGGQHLSDGGPSRLVEREHRGDEGANPWAKVFRIDGWVLALDDLEDKCPLVARVKGVSKGTHLVQDTSERPCQVLT